MFPLAYVIFTSVAGLAGYTYHYVATFEHTFSSYLQTEPVRFPYFFLDFDRLGLMVLAYIAGILAFILLLAHGIYALDRKVHKEKEHESVLI